MDAFHEGLTDCDLTDLGFQGVPFTWSNQRIEPRTIRCRLDIFCGNSAWRMLAPQSHVQHLTFPGSDHIPLMVRIRGEATRNWDSRSRGRRNRPWRFNAHWVRKEECEKVVREGWESALAPDCFDRLFQGIEACQFGLRQWSRDIHNNPRSHIEQLREHLHTLSTGPQTEQTRTEGAALRAELEKVYTDEDIFWRQRSKVTWAREGDRNTAYFHNAATARKDNNTIRGLFNRGGVWCEEDGEVEDIVTGYFEELFQTSHPSEELIDEVLTSVGARVSSEMNSQLAMPFTTEEVISALAQMALLKSPGPDGLPALFFHKYWHVVGSSITTCVLDF